MARLAPWAAGFALVCAVAARWFGWSLVVPAVALVAVIAALAVLLVWGGRALPVSDAAAATLDADANLGGELHSAHWFAGRDTAAATGNTDPEWAQFHLKHAEARVSGIDWAALYPAVKATRQWVMSGALIAVAILALSTGPRSRAAVLREQGLSAEEIEAALKLDMVPADIQAKIDALLGEIAEGGLTEEGARLKMDELRDLMAKLDEATKTGKKEADLAKGTAGEPQEGGMKPGDEAESLAAKAEEVAQTNGGLPEDVRWSLEDLANRLANAEKNKTASNDKNASATEQSGEKGNASENAEASQMAQAAGMQVVREAAQDASQAQMMNGGGGAMGGDSQSGAGGNKGGDGQMALRDLAQALRQEMIQAQQDQLGQNIDTDIRRKTEQSQAKVGFTRVPAPTSFDRSRAALPPPVPEAHRSLLQRYFQRRQ